MSIAIIDQMDFPDDLPQLRSLLDAEARVGRPIEPLLSHLAEHQPLALADVIVGPRAAVGAEVIRAALTVMDTLESLVPPRALYRRLLDLAREARPAVLLTAAERHIDAPWLFPMSFQVEGTRAGYLHLCAVPLSRLRVLCEQYAKEGAVEGMAAAGAARGSAVPAHVLMRAGDIAGAARAAAALLDAAPGSPVVEEIVAIWGPDLPPLLLALIVEARSQDVLDRLAHYTRWYRAIEIRRRQRVVELQQA
ncbi:MAG: hypothetical protein AAFV53_42165 [Myxococcota bacterium]